MAALVASCGSGGEPPALAVGGVGYTRLELGALSSSQRERLGDLTAFALVVARDEWARLASPLIERDRRSLLLQKLAAEVAAREAGLNDGELRAAYAESPEYELVVRQVVVLSERWRTDQERSDARRKAESALRRIRAGEAFARVAAEISDEPGAAQRGGLLRPGREGTWVPEFWEAASALEIGGTSDVVETEYGFHVLRLEERRAIAFEEVRDRILDRLVDLRATAARAEAWAEREATVLRLDTVAVQSWWPGRAPDDLVLASWPGGQFRGGDMRRYLLALDAPTIDRIAAVDDAAFTGVVRGAARSALLVARADSLGVHLAAPEEAAVDRRWRERLEGWATLFGFQSGMQVEEVKNAALSALTSSRQSVQIAREELAALSPTLRSVYPVIVADSTATGGEP